MSSLNEQVLLAVQATAGDLNDYGQRSAIGMARGWLDSQKFVENNSLDAKPARNALTAELVRLMEGHSKEDCIAALAEARKWVDAPFQNDMVVRERLAKPGEKKKAAKEKE